jgi:molybdopterin/thiamine biosynthesis adenylyltransferase
LENSEITINTGISLWNLEAGNEWHEEKNEGPQNVYMPRNIWTLGLGHLGQAYLWTIGLMHCSHPNEIQFLLQDNDTVESENIGSQVLSFYQHVGYPKTRACMNFLERIGFKTQIIEKPFVEGDDCQDCLNQYPFLLNGVDNIKTRKSINNDSFKLFLDGATNGKYSLFDSFTMKNISKYKKSVDQIWPENDSQEPILHKNLYARYEKEHKCGIMSNIGISTPFVGLFASTIVIAEIIRSLNHGKAYKIVSYQMRNLFDLTAICDGVYDNELQRFAV